MAFIIGVVVRTGKTDIVHAESGHVIDFVYPQFAEKSDVVGLLVFAGPDRGANGIISTGFPCDSCFDIQVRNDIAGTWVFFPIFHNGLVGKYRSPGEMPVIPGISPLKTVCFGLQVTAHCVCHDIRIDRLEVGRFVPSDIGGPAVLIQSFSPYTGIVI